MIGLTFSFIFAIVQAHVSGSLVSKNPFSWWSMRSNIYEAKKKDFYLVACRYQVCWN